MLHSSNLLALADNISAMERNQFVRNVSNLAYLVSKQKLPSNRCLSSIQRIDMPAAKDIDLEVHDRS